jgi:hypothetical protein
MYKYFLVVLCVYSGCVICGPHNLINFVQIVVKCILHIIFVAFVLL